MRADLEAAGFSSARGDVRTVRLHGALAERFGARHRLAVNSPTEAVRALSALKPGFRQALMEGNYRVIAGDVDLDVEQLDLTLGKADLHFIPVIEGEGKFGKIIAGIVLIGVSFVIPGAGIPILGSIAITANSVFGIGAALLLGGISQLLSPTPKAEKKQESNLFGGIQSTTVQGSPVPLIYGLKVRVDPIPISSGLKVDNGKDAYFEVVDLLGEGEIGGFVDGLKSVYLEDTPLENDDGSLNFEGVEVTLRTGTEDQEPIPGFEAVQNEIAVGAEVKKDTPIVRQVNNADADAARVTIRVPALFKQGDSGLKRTSVQLAIYVQPQGGSFQLARQFTITDKSQAPRDWQYRIDLKQFGGGPWNIRVNRLTNDSTDEKLINQTFWSSYTEITDHRLSYIRSAVVGIKIPAQPFGGSIPKRFYICQGRKIEVPSNFDPVTRNFDGEWNGTFKRAVSDDPAWVLWDLWTDRRAGLGDFLELGGVAAADKWGLLDISKYAAGIVPDGFGGTEFRYSFNGVLQSREKASDVVQAVASAFRGMTWWGDGGQVFASADMPSDPVLNVAPANVIGGAIDYPGSSLQERHTVFLVSWRNPENLYEHDVEVVEDPEGIQKYGYREASVQAVGCTSRGLASRLGRWALDTEKTQTQGANYPASFDHALAGPGELVRITDKRIAGVRMGGRVTGVLLDGDDAVGITVDAPVTIDAGKTYSVAVVNAEGAIEEREVDNPLGPSNTINFATPMDVAPVKNAMWALTASDLAPRQFRIVGILEQSTNRFEVGAIFHDPTKYARVESGLFLDPPNYTQLPTGPVLAPGEVQVDDFLYLESGTIVRAAVIVTWTPSPDPRVLSYQVQIRPEGLDWLLAATPTDVDAELNGIDPGLYDFRVRAIDAAGRPSPWSTLLAVNVDPFSELPGDVTGLRIVIRDDVATLSWDRVTDLSLSHYIVKFAAVLEGAVWGGAITLEPRVSVNSIQLPVLPGTYLVKAVSFAGIESANPALVTSNVAGLRDLNVVETFQAHPDWAGEKIDCEVENSFLKLTDIGGVLDWGPILDITSEHWTSAFPYPDGGLWTQDGYIDLGEVFTSRVTARILASGENVSDTIGSWPTLGSIEALGGGDADQWSVRLEASFTEDDPAGSPPESVNWSDWQEFVVGDLTFRAIRFRLFIFSLAPNVTPLVAEIEVEIDMPDRVDAGKNITIPIEGIRIAFNPDFRNLDGLTVTVLRVTGKILKEAISAKDESGFDVVIIDEDTGEPFEAEIDYVAKGYGRRVAA